MQLKRTDGSLIWEGEANDLIDAKFQNETLRQTDSLRGVDLDGIDCRHASFQDYDLRGANLLGATLYWNNLSGADLRGVALPDGVPVVPNIDAKILDSITENCQFHMNEWHGEIWDDSGHPCGMTYCRGGFAILVAGQSGKDLEAKFGTSLAAALIYAASRPDKPVPSFYAGTDEAMADIRACAAESAAKGGAA